MGCIPMEFSYLPWCQGLLSSLSTTHSLDLLLQLESQLHTEDKGEDLFIFIIIKKIQKSRSWSFQVGVAIESSYCIIRLRDECGKWLNHKMYEIWTYTYSNVNIWYRSLGSQPSGVNCQMHWPNSNNPLSYTCHSSSMFHLGVANW